ncbi:MAG: sugar ABC transporter substrate-binding protein [Acidimicrobiales bacterium]
MSEQNTALDVVGEGRIGRRQLLQGVGAMGGLLGLGGLLSACGGSSASSSSTTSGSTTSGSAGKGGVIGISLNVNNAYANYVAEAVEYAFRGTPYTFKGVVNNADAATELSNIESLIAAGIKGLVILPVNANTAAKGAELCHNAGIFYGNALWPGASSADKYFTAVADVNSVLGGQLIGNWLKANATPGKMIVVEGILGQGFSGHIDKGLNQALQGTNFQVVVRQQGFYSPATATSIVETGLQAHPDVNTIVTYSASMSDGVAAFLKSKGITNITHVASDCDETLVTYFGTPYLKATRYYSAAQTGLVAASAVKAALEGKPHSFKYPIKELMATEANIHQVVASDPFDYPQYQSAVSSF